MRQFALNEHQARLIISVLETAYKKPEKGLIRKFNYTVMAWVVKLGPPYKISMKVLERLKQGEHYLNEDEVETVVDALWSFTCILKLQHEVINGNTIYQNSFEDLEDRLRQQMVTWASEDESLFCKEQGE